MLKFLVYTATDPFLDTMRADIALQFPSLAYLELELAELFARTKMAFPAFKTPQVFSIVSGFSTDLYLRDGMLLIGLEHFTTDSARYESPNIPRYIRVRLRPNTIAPNVAQLLSDAYVATDPNAERGILDEMVRWGKVYYFMENVLPCTPDSLIAGYSPTVMTDVEANQKAIYNYFVSNRLFFEREPITISKFTGERPATPEIGDKCPGRIGRWLGWQIVRKYAKDKHLTLAQVMAETDARKIFDQAKWRPQD